MQCITQESNGTSHKGQTAREMRMVRITFIQSPKQQKVLGMELLVDQMETCLFTFKQHKTNLVFRAEKRGRACWPSKKEGAAYLVYFFTKKREDA